MRAERAKDIKMKICIIAICITIILGITGCADDGGETFGENTPDEYITEETLSEAPEDQTPTASIPAVMIDGTIYYLSQGRLIPDKEIELDQIGYTESEVSLDTFPERDGESNYAPAGTQYVKYGNGYALKLEEYGWSLFLTWEERLEE